ncbi:hypothetical protein HYR54_00260 [Candidatus Acetothermia bacterium]|nr:hypothetical protein [Candidatus Acetothermia bacterium]
MKLRLYYDAETIRKAPANEGFDLKAIYLLLKALEKQGVSSELIDTHSMTETELSQVYLYSTAPTQIRKYAVRQVFGSRRRSGWLFGRSVPALLVYEGENAYPTDVYPHNRGGRIITIREYLDTLQCMPTTKEKYAEALQAAKHMDARRAKLGPIKITVSELIHEGRRR